jgi:hypothetical protein
MTGEHVQAAAGRRRRADDQHRQVGAVHHRPRHAAEQKLLHRPMATGADDDEIRRDGRLGGRGGIGQLERQLAGVLLERRGDEEKDDDDQHAVDHRDQRNLERFVVRLSDAHRPPPSA